MLVGQTIKPLKHKDKCVSHSYGTCWAPVGFEAGDFEPYERLGVRRRDRRRD